MLDIDELKKLHDKAYNRGQTTRDKASDDLLFYWITQWDDEMLNSSPLAYRGQFDILRKAGRQIMSNIHSNPVQVDFEPNKPSSDDGAELMDGLYRTSTRKNTSKESFDNAVNEAIVAGFGGWELVNEYETDNVGERNQVINRKPIYESCNTLYWDPNANLLDKADAEYVSILSRYSWDGYRKLVSDLTGEELAENCSDASFKSPNQSYVFPWITEDKNIWVSRFYHRTKEKVTSYLFADPLGNEVSYTEEQFEEATDEIVDGGYEFVEERRYEVWVVTRYIASGEQILEETRVPGREIPVVPCYGERAYIEGEEHYEGITRLAKDPQRLRNFQLSYLADMVSRSPRQKPIHLPEQIQGFEAMYEETGSENNYPYLLQHRMDQNGNELPLGPIGETLEQKAPQALVQSIELSRQAVEDVANPGLPQNLGDPEASGKAVMAIQERMDMQTFIYQSNYKHAIRRDGEIFASMATEVYDSPRDVQLTLPDNTRKSARVMEEYIDLDAMELKARNDLRDKAFDVYADVGPSYTNQKQQTREELKELINGMAPGDPMRDILMAKYVMLLDGSGMDDVRDYANMRLIDMGVKEPETEKEIAAVQAKAEQANEPTPEQMIGQAELMQAENDRAEVGIKQYDAETDRMEAMTKAHEAGASIRKTNAQTMEIMTSPLRARVN